MNTCKNIGIALIAALAFTGSASIANAATFGNDTLGDIAALLAGGTSPTGTVKCEIAQRNPGSDSTFSCFIGKRKADGTVETIKQTTDEACTDPAPDKCKTKREECKKACEDAGGEWPGGPVSSIKPVTNIQPSDKIIKAGNVKFSTSTLKRALFAEFGNAESNKDLNEIAKY